MRLPRVSISTLMGVVVVVALDATTIRYLTNIPGTAITVITVLPVMLMASILAITGLLMLQRLFRQGECGPFVVGFLSFGPLAITVHIVLCKLYEHWIVETSLAISSVLVSVFEHNILGSVIIILINLAFLLMPQMLIALIGGCLASRYRNMRRDADAPRPV